MDKQFSKLEIEAIKKACSLVRSLCYTFQYQINEFKVIPDSKNNIQIQYQIKRLEKYNNEIIPIYQEGMFYISEKGKLFYYNLMGSKKPLKNIGFITGPYHQ